MQSIRFFGKKTPPSSFLKLGPSLSNNGNNGYQQQSVRGLTFTQQHEELKKTLRKIIDKDINPYVDQWEAEGVFPAHSLFKKLGDAGLMGITRPVEHGGLGLDYSYSMAYFEELANINCAGIPSAIMVQSEVAMPALVSFASDYLKKEFLEPSIKGDVVACIGISEISGGSDVAALKTTAKREGDDLVINGMKMWITNGTQADWMSMLANTSDGPVHKNKSLIAVPMKTPGIHVARRIEKMGIHSSDTAEIYFDNVRVPAKNIIGEEGMGFMYQMMQFQDERISLSAVAVAQMDRMIKETIEYCRQRRTFDAPLIDNQYIYFRLAELQAEVELLRALLNDACDKIVAGERVPYLAAVAKLKAGRLSRVVSDSCLQFFGGMGYTAEAMISRCYRDARPLSIVGGSDETMLMIIANEMGIMPKKKRNADRKDK